MAKAMKKGSKRKSLEHDRIQSQLSIKSFFKVKKGARSLSNHESAPIKKRAGMGSDRIDLAIDSSPTHSQGQAGDAPVVLQNNPARPPVRRKLLFWSPVLAAEVTEYSCNQGESMAKPSGSCLHFYPLWGQVLRLEVLIWEPRTIQHSGLQIWEHKNRLLKLMRQEIVQQIWAPARIFLIWVPVSEATFGIKDLPTFSNMIAISGFKSRHWIISTNLASLHTIVFWWHQQVKRTEEEEANCLCSGPPWLVDFHMAFVVQVWYRKFSNTWMRRSKEWLQNCGVLYISIWAAAHFWFIVKPKNTWATTIWMLTATTLAKQVGGVHNQDKLKYFDAFKELDPEKLNLYSKRRW